jgi:hypothetical protein
MLSARSNSVVGLRSKSEGVDGGNKPSNRDRTFGDFPIEEGLV